MGTSSIMFDRLVPPGGEFRPRTRVRIRLVAADEGEGTGYNATDHETTVGVADELLYDSELYVVDLTANASIDAPLNTVYEITRVYPGFPAPAPETFTVPAEPTPTVTTQAVTLPAANIAASTSGFPSSGHIYLGGQLVRYTGTTPTAFTGGTGGVGTIASGTTVRRAHWVGDHLANPLTGLPNLHVDNLVGAHAASAISATARSILSAVTVDAQLGQADTAIAGEIADRIADVDAEEANRVAAVSSEATARVAGDTTRTANAQAGDYVLVLADAGKVVEVDKATAVNVTVPPNASAAFAVGTIVIVEQRGTGAVTLVPGAGVSIDGTLTTPALGSSLLLRKRSTNGWDASIVSHRSGTYAGPTSGAAAAQPFLTKLRYGQSAKLLVPGDSTGVTTSRWVYLTAVALAAAYPALTVNYYAWNTGTTSYDAATVLQVGSGPGVLDVYNASITGSQTSTFLAPNFQAQIGAIQPDLTVISDGHNDARAGTASGEDYRERMLVLADAILAACPLTSIIIVAQNPQSANTHQTARAVEVYRIAAMRGFGVVDFFRAFEDNGGAAALTSDGIHPNAAGTALMVAEMAKALVYTPAAGSRPQSRPTLLSPGETLFTNSDFALFSGALPASWTGNNVTASKDLGKYESPNGYSVRLQTTTPGGGSSYITQDSPYLNLVKGQWVTVAARIYIAAGLPGTGVYGRLGVQTTGGTAPASLTSFQDPNGAGGWRWVVKSIYVPTDATALRVYIYAETSAGAAGNGDISVDRVVVCRGLLPAGAIGTGGPPGATGATGAAGTPAAGAYARKTANESRVDNTLADDDDLHVALLANTVYAVEAWLPYDATGASTPDFKVAFTIPSGASILVGGVVLSTAATSSLSSIDAAAYTTNNIIGGTVSGVRTVMHLRGTLRTAGTAGNLQLRWAQNVTTPGNATNLYADAFLLATVMA